MSRSPSPSNETNNEPTLDPDKVCKLLGVMGIEAVPGDHNPAATDVADDSEICKSILGAAAEELEPSKPTGDEDSSPSGSKASPVTVVSPRTFFAVKPPIAKTRRIATPSGRPLKTGGGSSSSPSIKIGHRTFGAPSSTPSGAAASSNSQRNNVEDDSDSDEVFQSSKYDDSDGSDVEEGARKKAASPIGKAGVATAKKQKRPKKKETSEEKAAREKREREEAKRAQQQNRSTMRNKQLKRRQSALEVLDGLIPLGAHKHQPQPIGFTRQRMIEHAKVRMDNKSSEDDAAPTEADKALDAKVKTYLSINPDEPRDARQLVSDRIQALRMASNVPGTLDVLDMRRSILDPTWLPMDDALHKKKDASHAQFRKLDGAMRELKQEQELTQKGAAKRQAWINAALASAPS